jgi:hypothetical protein
MDISYRTDFKKAWEGHKLVIEKNGFVFLTEEEIDELTDKLSKAISEEIDQEIEEMNKKQLRDNFREAVFKRDNFECKKCGAKSTETLLDAHHIVDRHLMINGGYVVENGITLCNQKDGCHWKAEQLHRTGISYPDYSPDDLYALIGSSYEKAVEASEKLNVS